MMSQKTDAARITNLTYDVFWKPIYFGVKGLGQNVLCRSSDRTQYCRCCFVRKLCWVIAAVMPRHTRLVWQLYNRDLYRHKDDISVICELLAVKHGDMELDLFCNSVLDAFIEFLCTKKLFNFFINFSYCFLVHEY